MILKDFLYLYEVPYYKLKNKLTLSIKGKVIRDRLALTL
jgi:hypothetical protein